MKFALSLLLAIALFSVARADLPVHCLHENTSGEWLIYKSPIRNATQPFKCPNGIESVDNIAVIKLKSPNVVQSKNVNVGQWTMVYDQGFEFTMGNQIFFAFNRFEKNATTKFITSYCGQTSFGWYREKGQSQHGCFFARKVNSKHRDTQVSLPVNSLLYLSPEEAKKLNTHRNDVALVDSINANEKWQAQAYDFFEEMSDAELLIRSGIKVSRSDVKKLKKQSEMLALADDEEMSELRRSMLPKNYDWRNVSGVNYVGDVRDQSSCGSCYGKFQIFYNLY
jgi:cathepsin C